MKRMCLLVAMIFICIGCATYRPIVDMSEVDPAKYEQDLKECQEYATQISPIGNATTGALIGAGAGAILGAIVGSFFGDAEELAAFGAAIGGVQGAGGGAAQGMGTQIDIIRRCMQGRGYIVLH